MKGVSATPLALLDREQCLADLDRWAFTTSGGGCIALVHGEAGIGKTALMREFTRRCPQRRVLWGSCDDLFTPRVLAPLHDMASQSKGTLFDAINAGANRDVIFNVVLDDLEHGTPATVVFEDMQWADEATLDLLKFLGRRIARTRAMLVITYRDNETGPRHALRSVIGDLPREHIRHLALTPLGAVRLPTAAREIAEFVCLTLLREKLAHVCHLIHQIARDHFGALIHSARAKLDRGDWIGCSDDVEAVLRSSNPPPAAKVAALTLLVQIRARRGDPDTHSPLEDAQALALQLKDLRKHCDLVVARAERAWLLDDREAVIRAVGPVYELARLQSDPKVNGSLAVWLFRANALEDDATDFAEPYAAEIAGNWRAAADAWEQRESPYEHATVLALYGGEVEKREALAIFEALGASPAARAIRKQFRAQGVKRIPRGARPTTQSNRFGLTRREAEVLDLLSKGLRNSAIARALFVSQKTVDHHVSSILSKLGVPSRVAAVVAAQGRAGVATARVPAVVNGP